MFWWWLFRVSTLKGYFFYLFVFLPSLALSKRRDKFSLTPILSGLIISLKDSSATLEVQLQALEFDSGTTG